MTCISMIVAMADNHIIGNKNKMPWHLPEDLKHFKNITMGKPIIMGRKTFQSIGKPLPGRENIVITRDHNFSAEGITLKHDLASAIKACVNADEVMIIGGGQLYQQALNQAQRLYITRIFQSFEGDTQFPAIDNNWQLTQEESHQAQAGFEYRFQIFERI